MKQGNSEFDLLALHDMTMGSVEIPSNLGHCKSLQQLWFACAGSGITIPQVGDLVFYFPQGHLEQTGGLSMHLHAVPSQILCRVINVELKSENDYVHACMALMPEPDQGFEAIDGKGLPSSTPRLSAPYFCKKLRVADTISRAWFSIPRKHAEKFLPPLDMTKMAPMQELVAKDLSGMMWRFQHRLVGPRRHLLQTADYATSKNLAAGDFIVILRGEDGQLRVGVRRCMRNLGNMPPSEITNDGVKTGLGILPSISHAITAMSMFNVIYRPRTGAGQFVVPYDRYVESGKICSVGTRFRMTFRQATTEHRVSGIILGIEDFDETWPDSKWRCLKVKLNKDSSIAIPYRVSPWEIEPQKRSSNVILTYYPTKKPWGRRGLFREDSRQKATVLATHNPSCVDPEACLNNAKYILQLCQDGSLTHTSSPLVENRIHLSAVDALICLSTGSSSFCFSSVEDLRMQAKAALDIAMSELARTFHGLKLWNTNHFKDLDCLPSTMSNLYSPSALDSLCLSSSSSEPVSSSSYSTRASSRDSELMPAEDCTTLHRIMSCLDEKKLDLINRNSIHSVRIISSRMIQAGFTERLRDTFTDLSQELIRDFHILDSNWIFQCHSRFDEGDSSSVGESMRLQYWNLASQFITRVLVEMRRQLNEADLGAFDELKADYFARIVEQPVSKLLNASSTSAALNKLLEEIPPGLVECVQSVFPRIIHALSTYSTLSDIVPTLLELVSPDSRESVSRESEAIRKKVEDMVNRMLGTLTDAMSASFLPEAEDTDVHPVTKAVAEGTRSLLEHRDSLNLILAHSCCRVHEGAPAIESLDSLISGLILHLKSVLQRSCTGLLPKESQYIFLLNNMQFILSQFKSSAMDEPIGLNDWAIEHDKTMEHYMELYIETCWAPVSSHLAAKDGKRLRFWRHSCMQQFTVAFQSVYAKQRHWKVPDPHLRQALRASISRKLIPAYCEYLEKHQNGSKSLTREELEDLLSELFEG